MIAKSEEYRFSFWYYCGLRSHFSERHMEIASIRCHPPRGRMEDVGSPQTSESPNIMNGSTTGCMIFVGTIYTKKLEVPENGRCR